MLVATIAHHEVEAIAQLVQKTVECLEIVVAIAVAEDDEASPTRIDPGLDGATVARLRFADHASATLPGYRRRSVLTAVVQHHDFAANVPPLEKALRLGDALANRAFLVATEDQHAQFKRLLDVFWCHCFLELRGLETSGFRGLGRA